MKFRSISAILFILVLVVSLLTTGVRSQPSSNAIIGLTPVANLPLIIKEGTPGPTPSASPTVPGLPTTTSTNTPTLTTVPSITPSPTVTPCSSVSGLLNSDTIWVSNCIYIMTGNVIVPEGVTLTMQPGVTVLVDGYYSLQIAGILKAEGTQDKRITLTQRNDAVIWREIQFISGTTERTSSSLAYVDLSHSQYGIDVTGGKNIPTISYCTIEDNGYGIYSASAYSIIPMSISHSYITRNGSGISLRITGGGTLSITYNTIVNNGIGIDGSLSFTSFNVNNNNLYDNQIYNIEGANVVPGSNEVIIDATNNWWGTTNLNDISAKIHDCNDDTEVGCVSFQPITSGPINGAP